MVKNMSAVFLYNIFNTYMYMYTYYKLYKKVYNIYGSAYLLE
jgi:hypothetical protein